MSEVRGVLRQEPDQGNQRAPDIRPVMMQASLGLFEIRHDAEDDAQCEPVEVDVETFAEVVAERVGADVEDGGCGHSGRGDEW